MRTYSVFEPPVLPGAQEDDAQSLVFIRHGWSLLALFFPLFWMLLRKLWWVLLAYVLIIVGIQALNYAVNPLVTIGLSVALALIVMIEAGQLRLETMAAKGYREVAVVRAKNQQEAEHLYFTQWIATRRASSKSVSTGNETGRQPGGSTRTPVLRPTSATPPALPGLPS